MDYITSFYNFFNLILSPFQYNNKIDDNKINDNQINNNQIDNNIIYIFINTANIHEATQMMLESLNEYHNRRLIIYLLLEFSIIGKTSSQIGCCFCKAKNL